MNCEFTRSCEESIRRAPLATVGGAAVAGLVLSKLPLAAILGVFIRLALALVKPALLIFGICKLVEYSRKDSAAPAPPPTP